MKQRKRINFWLMKQLKEFWKKTHTRSKDPLLGELFIWTSARALSQRIFGTFQMWLWKPFSIFLVSDFKTPKKRSAKNISDQRLLKQQDNRLNQRSSREQLNRTSKQAAIFTLSFKCAAEVFLTTIFFCKHLDFSYWQKWRNKSSY